MSVVILVRKDDTFQLSNRKRVYEKGYLKGVGRGRGMHQRHSIWPCGFGSGVMTPEGEKRREQLLESRELYVMRTA